MKIFLAGIGEHFKDGISIYQVPYALETFYTLRKFDSSRVKKIISQPKDFLLDSGAFTFFHSGKTVDWDQYLESYIQFINEYDVQKFFELDVDALLGVKAVEKMTARLERETGKKSIPVFHQCRGIDWYREACEKYDYVALSASRLTQETKWTKSKKALRYLIKIAHDNGAIVHGLGYTVLDNINNTTVPFDSVDSTAWLSGGRFATVYKFTGNQMISRKVTHRSIGYSVLDDRNLKEWVKLCNYKAQGDKW